MIDKFVNVFNRYLRDKGLELVDRDVLAKYIEPVISEDDEIYLERFKCSTETIYYYNLFKRAFDSQITEAPALDDIDFKLMNKFKSIIGDVKKSTLKHHSGEDIVEAARNYNTCVNDRDFFYKEILNVDDFLDRIKVFLVGGSIWSKYLEEKQKDNIVPTRLKNFGFIHERDVSPKYRDEIKNLLAKNLTSKAMSALNDGRIVVNNEEFESAVSFTYIQAKVWTNRKFKYPDGDEYFKINYSFVQNY